MKKLYLIILSLAVFVSLQAQNVNNFSVTGKVVSIDGDPIAGVVITAEGAQPQIATVTGVDGSYSIGLPSGTISLTFASLGLENRTVPVNNRAEINIAMEPDETLIDEVVVVGYQTQKRVTVTGAVSAISGADIVKRDAPNLSSALQGLMPGVSVVQASGQPGMDGGAITIRGIGSVNSNTAPLILIDGVQGDMNQVDMNAVESVSVLKDASAAIYGSRASNGVILVTTKRGQSEKIQVSYSGYFAITSPTDMPKPISGVEFMEFMNIANRNTYDNMPDPYPANVIEEFRRYGPDNWTTFDTRWAEEILKDRSLAHRHSVSISGKGNVASFFVDGSYQFQDGLIDNNDFTRKTLRVNTDINLAKWAKFSVDFNAFGTNETVPSIASPISLIGNALMYNPVYPGINRDGTWGEGRAGYNPIAIIKEGGTRRNNVTGFGTTGKLDIKLPLGIEWNTMFNYRMQIDDQKTVVKPYDTYRQGQLIYTYPDAVAMKEGRTTMYYKKNQYIQFNTSLGYKGSFSGHNINAFVGIQLEELLSQDMTGSRDKFDIPGYDELANGSTNQQATSARNGFALFSYYGAINYNYKEKYLLEVTGRIDGSSRFMPEYRWGVFPGVSAGWRISEEPFWEPVKEYVSSMKIRLSYGQFGNQDLQNYYPFISNVNIGLWNGYPLGGKPEFGALQAELYNPFISWETSTQTNIGFDFGFFKNKLGLTVDLYNRSIANMIEKPLLPDIAVLPAPYFNLGRMRARGYDISVSYRNSSADGNWRYSLTGNFSDAESRIVEVSSTAQSEDFDALRPGEYFKAMRGLEIDGFYKDQNDIDNSPTFASINKENLKPGDLKYHDKDGDGVVELGDDKYVFGDGSPRYLYSLSADVSWKNFDLSVFIQGVGEQYKRYNGSGIVPFSGGNSMFDFQRDFWTEDNQDAEFPRLTINGGQNYYASSLRVRNVGYVRLKNVSLGYNIPKKIISRIRLQKARVYVSGQNLVTLSNALPGFDPEGDNTNMAFYPVMRTFTVGLDLKF